MAPTITRLVLSLALIVAAPVCYTIVIVAWMEIGNRYDSEMAFLAANIVVGSGFAFIWLVIWLFEVKWNLLRVAATVCVFFGAVLLSVMVGLLIAALMNEEELGLLFGGMLFAVFWLFGTGLAWMELPGERRRRLAAVGMDEVICPKCGYNLRGLKVTACPECGTAFTLDTLFAAQLERQKTLGDA